MMDISAFFPLANATDEEKAIDEYKKTIFNLANKGYVTTLQYSYLINFVKTMGSVCNLNWLLEQISQLHPLEDPKKKKNPTTNIEKDENIVEFKNVLGKTFKHLFRYKDDELRINKNIRYYLTRLDSIDLTKEQKNAMHTLYNFIMDHTEKTMGLYGFAGSGKTTTIVEFVSYMLRNKYLHTIAFSAPTNKALNVIKGKFRPHLKNIIETIFDKELGDIFNFDDELDFLEQQGIVIKFLTIHKLLMFQTDFSLDGTTIFVRDEKQGSMISQFELVVIDECSMIGMDMIDSLFEELRSMSKNQSCKSKGYTTVPKIVFSGDPAQLPPVHEEDSSIFCKNEDELPFATYMQAMSFKYESTVSSDSVSIMEYRYKILMEDLSKMKTILLKNVVRSRIDNVTLVCHEFRKWIKSDKLPALEKYKNTNGVYFFNNDQTVDKVKSAWFKKFLESVKNNESNIIITWTNKQTDIYNDTIRRQIFRGQKLHKFEPNDVLMLSDFYSLDLGEKFCKQILYTSEQIKVITTKMSDVPINSFEMINNNVIKRMKQAVKIEGQIKMLIDGLNEFFCKNVKFTCWILKVNKFGEEIDNNMTIIVIDDTASEKYEEHKNKSALAIKNFSRQLLNQYRAAPKQIEKLIIKPLWKQWNKIFVESFACVSYGYSITCHKGQGSSFENTFIDLDDILQNQKQTEARKCAYTAVTRTSNELNILI
jgi:ribulose bisphosphate carboxylase small subunit